MSAGQPEDPAETARWETEKRADKPWVEQAARQLYIADVQFVTYDARTQRRLRHARFLREEVDRDPVSKAETIRDAYVLAFVAGCLLGAVACAAVVLAWWWL